jgi:predicted HTH domain antitoxin
MKMTQIKIDCPDELLTDKSLVETAALAQQAFVVRVYQLGHISSGKAAEILHISRRDFLNVLGNYGVSIFDEDVDIQAEARCGRQ